MKLCDYAHCWHRSSGLLGRLIAVFDPNLFVVRCCVCKTKRLARV